MSTEPASPEPAAGAPRRPAPLVVATSLAALEGAALLVLAALELASLDPDRVSLAVSTSVFFLVTGAAVLGCALAASRLHSWGRGPLLLTQLIMLGLAWNLRSLPLMALLLLVVAVVALGGFLHPDTMRALGQLPEDDPDA